MIESISGIFGRINEINARIDEIKSLGKNPSVTSLEAYTTGTGKENNTTTENGQTFSEVLKQVLEDNGTLPGMDENTSLDYNKINQLAGSKNDSKALLELLYKNLKTESGNGDIKNTIEEAANSFNMDPSLIKAVIQQESQYNKNATSAKGAMGLMQLMPDTAELLGVTDPYNVEQNITGGTKYLKMLMNKYNNNLDLSLAAYNAGPEAVDKFGDVPPYDETQNYVKNVLKLYNDYKSFK